MFGNQLKKKYTMGQLYLSFVNGFVALPAVVKNHRKRTVDPHLIERLMLATTEVNGCEVCSYAHTRMALVEGFGQDEIEAFLSGSKAYVKAEEATAILYAQHVADTMGQPDLKAWERLVATYGEQHAAIMRAGITVMMMGNISGIPLSALLRRLRGKPYENSSLLYELSMLLIQPVFMLGAAVQAMIAALFKY
ncbi:MAG: carboxymuconolactone decarboxylase family protein [Eubacteriales bacterium]|nr:carboxymuconolactone decarboxylase family protein [Eubacteriales bacterium]